MLGCVQHSYSCCIDRIGYKQLHSNGNSGLLGMRPLQKNSGNAFQSMRRYPLLKQGNHYRYGVEKNIFKREKTLLSGYPFLCLSGVEKDSCTVQQSDACVIGIVSPAMGHSQEAHPESNLSIPAITSALEKVELAPKHRGSDIIELQNCILAVNSKSYVSALQKAMDLASQDGLVYVFGPTYASSTVRASSISYKPPPIGFGHHPIPKGRIGFCTFGNVAARHVQRVSATVSQLIRHGRAKKRHKTQNQGLSNCPQKQGVCILVKESLPKKPNSGKRKTARVRLSNGQDVTCLIPGEGHNLMEHSIVLVRGGGVKDLPGVNYRCVRGTRDLKGIRERQRGRSKSGTKKARKKPEN